MTTIFSQRLPSAQQEEHPSGCSASSALPDLATLSTLWVPLHEPRQQWAAFGQEALTTSALMATGTAFGGLYWETHALQHYTWAADERERGRWHQVVFWLSRAIQDLDCALDQWQQVLSWLDLAGNDHTLMAQVQWHQSRRRLLHQQVLRDYSEARQHKQQQWEQQGREHKTEPPIEAHAEEGEQ